MRSSLSGGMAVSCRLASVRMRSRPPSLTEVDGLLSRVAGGLSTAADARKLRILLRQRAVRASGSRGR